MSFTGLRVDSSWMNASTSARLGFWLRHKLRKSCFNSFLFLSKLSEADKEVLEGRNALEKICCIDSKASILTLVLERELEPL